MTNHVLDLIEYAYRLGPDEHDWFAGLARRAALLVPSASGAMAYSFDASAPGCGVTLAVWGAHGVPKRFTEATIRLNSATTPAEAVRFYHQGVVSGTVSERLASTGARIEENQTYASSVARHGFPDTFGLTASCPTFRGVAINSPLSRPLTIRRQAKDLWCRIGVHLQAAYRLRSALDAGGLEAEAVIDPSRGVVHAEGEAQKPHRRGLLEAAARSVDAERTRRGSRDPDAALAFWQGLVDGRWSLIEQFESDGRRFFIAYPNSYGIGNPRALTQRERLVVAHVVQGDPNKWIAYQLGISEGTVARHVSASLRKLGLSHRNQLIWIYHSISRHSL
jgi:DNA-binding CsgD family transcriptional regulator